MSSVRRSGRAPKPKQLEQQLTVGGTPRRGRGGRGRGRGGRGSTAARTPRPVKRPWEHDHDEGSDSASSEEEEDVKPEVNAFDFDVLDEDFDLDSVSAPKQETSYEEYPEDSECPWVEGGNIPYLELPQSSRDLAFPSNLLLSAVEVYELVRSFYRTIYFSPCLLEDFCAALATTDNSPLMTELHITMLKMCLRDDEEEQVQYTVMDTHNSFNILVQLIEPMTYAEVLRIYAEANRETVPPEALAALSGGSYPYVGAAEKLDVLHWLCDRFLQSQEYKKIVRNEGRLISEDKCRECNKPGDFLPCFSCEAVFHIRCLGLEDVPDGHWNCPTCDNHKTRGLVDCVTLRQNLNRIPMRTEHLGRDRHGRFYWFTARRLFVTSMEGGDVHYYSTAVQLCQLISRLDPLYYEAALCRQLQSHLLAIVDQMAVTLELTGDRRTAMNPALINPSIEHAYLHLDNLNRIAEVLSESHAREQDENIKSEEVKSEEGADEEMDQPIRTKMEGLLGIQKGILTNQFWSAGVPHDGVLSHKVDRDNAMGSDNEDTGFKMGSDDGSYKKYINYFNDDNARPFALRQKEKDKRKYMAGRFSLAEEGHFEWTLAKGKDLYGSLVLASRYVEWQMSKMHKRIPTDLMHRRWSEHVEAFVKELGTGRTVESLRKCLQELETGMRKTLFLPQWWSSVGSTSFRRMSLEAREQKQKEEKIRKKMDRELVIADAEDESIVWVKYTKLGGPPRHAIWRMKDEQYRINGREQLGGWYWARESARRERKQPPKPADGDGHFDKKQKTINDIADRLSKRLEAKGKEAEVEGPPGCFSPSCDGSSACYSLLCRQKAKKATASAAIARKGRLLGKEVAYPLPTVYNFDTKNGRPSIFIMQKQYLRRLAVSGGLSPHAIVPGFSHTAKANFSVWNYPTYRPLFDHCWRLNTSRCRSMQGLALQLRLLWAGVRWADMRKDETDKHEWWYPRVVIHHGDRDEIREVIGHSEMPPDGIYERYEISLTAHMLDEADDGDNDYDEGSRSSQRESRKRKAASRSSAKKTPKVTTTWVDGVDLKLHEIERYWKEYREKRTKREAPAAAANGYRPARTGANHVQGRYAAMAEGPVLPPAKRMRMDGYSTPRSAPGVVYTRDPEKYSAMIGGANGATGGVYHDESEYSVRRTATGREYPVGFIRGGGAKPEGSMDSAAPQATRRIVVVNSGGQGGGQRMGVRGEEGPPTIPRYDSPSTQRPFARTAVPTQRVAAGAGKVIMIRRPDGSTQLLRPVGGNGMEEAEEGTRFVSASAMRGRGGMSFGGATRVVRQMNNPVRMGVNREEITRTQDPFMKRMAMEKAVSGQPGQRVVMSNSGTMGRRMPGSDVYASYYGERRNEGISHEQYRALAAQGYRPPGRPPGRLATTSMGYGMSGGSGGRMIPRTQMYSSGRYMGVSEEGEGEELMTPLRDEGPINEVEESSMGSLSPYMRRTSTYRDFVDRRNIGEPRWRGNRPYRFDFESNEEESQAIQDAIAREEEIMRIEDEMKRGNDPHHISEFTSDLWLKAEMPAGYSSNLVHRPGDSPDTSIIKHMLDTMVMQVCKWDKAHGWSKAHGVPGGGGNFSRLQPLLPPIPPVRRLNMKHHELALNERMEYMRREINKRRSLLESQAENEVGSPAPWRKIRGRPNKGKVRMVVCSRNSSSSLADDFLPHFYTEDDDWKRFAYLLDTVGLPDGKETEENDDSPLSIDIPSPPSIAPVSPIEGPLKGRSEVVGLRLSTRIQQRCLQTARTHYEKKMPLKRRKGSGHGDVSRRHTRSPSRMENPMDITLGEGSQLVCESPRKRRDSHKSVKKEEADDDSIAHRTRHGRNSESDASGRYPKRAKVDSTSDSIPSSQEHGHCVCNKAYNPKKTYVKCIRCTHLYHAKCMGMTEKKAKRAREWACPNCREEGEEELFCLCRTPYDDTRFYVGCESCEGWYHLSCVGITQHQAESMAEYICPACKKEKSEEEAKEEVEDEAEEEDEPQPGPSHGHPIDGAPLGRADFPLLLSLLEVVSGDRNAVPFRQPVDTLTYPEYSTVVEEPMDLLAMRHRLENLEYRRLGEMDSDFRLMIANARLFNKEHSTVWKAANSLEGVWEERLQETRRLMAARREKMRKQSECGTVDSCLDIDTDQLFRAEIDPSMFEALL